jgi:hypothetical protein
MVIVVLQLLPQRGTGERERQREKKERERENKKCKIINNRGKSEKE